MISSFDNQILEWVISYRSPQLSVAAVEVTALGAGSVLALFVTFFSLMMFAMRKSELALQLIFVSLGSHFITRSLKNIIERDRPPIASRLVEVEGFSFPSGHSLSAAAVYLALALLAIPLFPEKSQKWILGGLAGILICLIGLSRIYLGVHYPSDVIVGITLGMAWALFVHFAVSLLNAKKRATLTS